MPIRTFSLHSQDFYDAVTEPMERPWIPNGALPREPRCRDLEVLRDEDVWRENRASGIAAIRKSLRV